MTASSTPTDCGHFCTRFAGLMRQGFAWIACITLCFVVLWATPVASAAGTEQVRVETSTGTYVFETEIADTADSRARGLMFRQHLPDDRAMLFDWGRDLVATMWMRNTPISLDMIFIRRDGTVESIVENTTPQSLEVVSSRGLVAAVLEVAAGTASRIGLKPGDTVHHAMFQP